MTNSFFSSKHSALILGGLLGASVLFGGITFAQGSMLGQQGNSSNMGQNNNNLTINTNGLTNNRITIRQIYLSPTGSAATIALGATIALDGSNGSITANTTTIRDNITIIARGQECTERVKRHKAEIQDAGGSIDHISDNCILYIDPEGKVHVTASLDEWLNDTTNNDVFKRNPTNPRDSYFANTEGKPSTVSKANFLRVGVTQAPTEAFKDDAAMVVGGSIESRGGTFIRKIDGQEANAGNNLNVTFDQRRDNYTSVDNSVAEGKVFFESEQILNRNPQDTSFIFSNKSSSNKTRVGINTTDPQADLHLAGRGKLQVGDRGRNTTCFLDPVTGLMNCGNNAPFFSADGESQKVTIMNNTFGETALEVIEGNALFNRSVGIGTQSPRYNLDVHGTSRVTTSFAVKGANDDLIAQPGMGLRPSDPEPCGIRGCAPVEDNPFFSADGKTNVVNIRKNMTTRDQNVLNVYGDTTLQGTVKATSYLAVGYPTDFRPSSTDKLFIDGTARANAYYYNSDARYKANIALLETPLEKVLSLHGYSYYNKLSEKNDIGVIAQEVEKAFPELVQTDAEGYKSVSYGNLVAPLIEAVKELSHKIDELFNKYADQQSQIDALEARIQALEQAK